MLKHQDLQMFDLKLSKYDYFFRTWSCGSQLQAGENLN